MAFAFSNIFCLHHRPPQLPSAYSGFYACTTPRVIQVYRLSLTFNATDGVRTSLYTEQYNKCVGSLSKLTDLTTNAILALEPKGSSSSARFTIRNNKTLLTLSIPTIPRSIACNATKQLYPDSVLSTSPLPVTHPKCGDK